MPEAIELDPLDLLVKPPVTWQEKQEAYWQYLQCSRPGCRAWLWRRHLGDGAWGLRCYLCSQEWRTTFMEDGLHYWDPRHKREYQRER